MKKIILLSVFALFIVFVPHAFAQSEGFVPLAPIPGLTQGITADQAGLATFFNNLYKFLIGIAATLAVIVITWEGIRIAYNQDNVSTVTDSKGKIAQAIFGLVLVLAPALVFGIINPSILNLSLNLEKIDLTTPAPQGPTPGTGICNPSTNTDNRLCRERLLRECIDRGGTPQQTLDQGRTIISCIISGPLAPGSTMTVDECTGQPTNGRGVIIRTNNSCSTASATERAGGDNCRDLSGTNPKGICVW